MNKLSSLFLCLAILWSVNASAQRVQSSDFEQLLGANWTGTLTYLDYSSNEETAIPVKVNVKKINKNKFVLAFNFNDEPHANSKESLKLKKRGRYLNKERVLEKKQTAKGLEILTQSKGKDNGQPATYYITYLISDDQFVIKKEVQYTNKKERFERNRFEFRK